MVFVVERSELLACNSLRLDRTLPFSLPRYFFLELASYEEFRSLVREVRVCATFYKTGVVRKMIQMKHLLRQVIWISWSFRGSPEGVSPNIYYGHPHFGFEEARQT